MRRQSLWQHLLRFRSVLQRGLLRLQSDMRQRRLHEHVLPARPRPLSDRTRPVLPTVLHLLHGRILLQSGDPAVLRRHSHVPAEELHLRRLLTESDLERLLS